MARNYSTTDFFRRMPNRLLARYFRGRGYFPDLDIEGMKETRIEPLFQAWLTLPDADRNRMDSEFREIFDLGCPKGFQAAIDEATWRIQALGDTPESFVEDLATLASDAERAMVVFLDHPQVWKGAMLFYHADSLSWWRKRKNLHCAGGAAVDEASVRELEELISAYFHHHEGRGRNCKIEVFRRGDREYFFAYPEDHSKQSIEWVNGQFAPRPHNPAFEVVFVYSQKDGELELNFHGSHKAVEPLQGMFATAILKLEELPPDPRDSRVYDLNPLRRREFAFVVDPTSEISVVAVRKIRLSSRYKRGDRVTIEADPTENATAVYDLLEQLGKALPLSLYNVTQVELVATVTVDPQKGAKRVTVRLTHPNSCSIKYDEIGIKLQTMLVASGIEPKDAPVDQESELMAS